MENMAEAPRVSHFLASNQDECLLGDTMSSCMLPSKVLELLGCGEAHREYIFHCLLVAVTVLLFALLLYFLFSFSLSPGCAYLSSILNID